MISVFGERNEQRLIACSEKANAFLHDGHFVKIEETTNLPRRYLDQRRNQQTVETMHKSIVNTNMCRPIVIILVYSCAICIYQAIEVNAQNGGKEVARSNDECQVTPVIHVLQYPGCVPKPIPSFACIGRCSSYLQVMSIWNAMLLSK